MEKVKEGLNKKVSIRNALLIVLFVLVGFILGSISAFIVSYKVIEKMLY